MPPGGTSQWPVPPSVTAEHPELGSYEFYCESRPELLFCNNETNVRRLYGETDAPGLVCAVHAFAEIT